MKDWYETSKNGSAETYSLPHAIGDREDLLSLPRTIEYCSKTEDNLENDPIACSAQERTAKIMQVIFDEAAKTFDCFKFNTTNYPLAYKGTFGPLQMVQQEAAYGY